MKAKECSHERLSLLPMRAVILLITLLFGMSTWALSQAGENFPEKDMLKNNQAVTRGASYTAWYNYSRLMQEKAFDWSYFRLPLFPDSTVYVEYDNGYDKVSKHSVGQVLDPYAPMFADKNMQLDTGMGYYLDSIGIYYRYFRCVGNQPDLLVVQVYRGASVNMVENPNWSSRSSYASVGYDPILRRGAKAEKDFTFFLENDDTTGFGEQKLLKFPVDWELEKGERVAVVATYFPINPYLTGDTLDPYSSIKRKRKINAFLMYEFRDNDPNVERSYYNNGLFATWDVRYDATWNFWRKKFKPGTLWASSLGIYHSDISFKLRTDNPLGEEQLRSNGSMEIFRVNTHAREIEVSAINSPPERIQLYEINGRTIDFQIIENENTLNIQPIGSYQGVCVLMLNEQAFKIVLQ